MKVKTGLIEAHLFRLEEDGIRFLLIKRSQSEIYPGLWQMVTGKIEEGEKAFQTALREIKEETNLNVHRLWSLPNLNSFYSPSEDSVVLVPVFAALVEEAEVKLSAEHTDFKWVDVPEALRLLPWEGQRKSVEIIEHYFTKDDPNFKLLEIDFKKP